MKRLITAAAISVTLFAAGCSSDSTPASQAEPSTETPAPETPTTETDHDGGLITTNAGFKDGSEGWEGNAVNVMDDGSGSNNINFASIATAGNSYDVNLSRGLEIEQGKTYDLSFKAKSDVNRTLVAGIGLNQDPWTNKSETINLTPEWQTFTLTLTAEDFGHENSRVLFDMGADVGEVWLDDVSLKEGTSTSPELSQIDLPVNFEGDEVDYTVTDFGGAISSLVADPADATNMVIRTIKAADAQTWAGTTIGDDVADVADDGGLATVIPFTETATTMSVRVYSPDSGIPVRLKIERSDNNEVTAETETLTTVANEWETLVFDLNSVAAGTAAFDAAAGYDKASIFFNFSVAGETVGEKTYYWDDVTFGGEATTTPPPSTATEPTDAPAAPTAAATDVISIYSDAYTNIAPVDTNPNWGQATVTTEESIAGNSVLKMAGLNYQGIAWDDNKQNVSCFESLHVDYWTADATAFQVYAIGSLGESAFDATVVTGSWQSLDIPLSTYSSVGLTEARQFKFVGDGTVYIDNLYYSNTAGAGTMCDAAPADPAPVDTPVDPTTSGENVSSIYSDAYTDVALSAFPTSWSSAGLETQTHADNEVQKMTGGFIGIEPVAGIDGTGYSHMHVDIWAAEGESVLFKVRDYGPNGTWDAEGDDSEIAYTHTIGANSTWESVDVPLSNATKASLSQIVIDAQNAGSKIYFDNIYFY